MDKVLIAEDDRIHLKRMSKVLGKYNDKFEVVEAVDGQEAIDILKEQPVSVLVTDIQMPRVDGLVLLAYVNEHHPNLPCLVMTAYGTPQMKAKLPKDLLRFFHKPFIIEDLARAVIDILGQNVSDEAFHGISLESFLHIIEMEQISCMLEMESSAKTPGVMYFKNGILYDAVCKNLKGEPAALELIPQKMETFRFKILPAKDGVRRIQTSLTDLFHKALTKEST
ncbi:MAG: response regulator [Desulfobacterales bacterium]|nr:response regulator [Desulfobacterales bacterium]